MFRVKLHNRVSKFLKNLSKKQRIRCRDSIDELAKNPFVKRSGCDIKKLGGRAYRLRVGNIRFNYVVLKNEMIIHMDKAFYRGRGYR